MIVVAWGSENTRLQVRKYMAFASERTRTELEASQFPTCWVFSKQKISDAMKLLGLVCGNEGYPRLVGISCVTSNPQHKSSKFLCSKSLVQIPGVTASNAYHEKYTLLNNLKINFQLPFAVVQLSQVYSFIWSPKPSLSALVERVRFLEHTVGAE